MRSEKNLFNLRVSAWKEGKEETTEALAWRAALNYFPVPGAITIKLKFYWEDVRIYSIASPKGPSLILSWLTENSRMLTNFLPRF